MATQSTNPNAETNEETEPTADEAEDNTQVADAGVPGQIQYPDRTVDAERAAAFAAGKVDSLDPDDEDGTRSGWQNPADRSGEVTTDEDTDSGTRESTNPNAGKTNE